MQNEEIVLKARVKAKPQRALHLVAQAELKQYCGAKTQQNQLHCF